jgi:hypothetical protein
MSCDTEYTIRVSASKKKTLLALKKYLGEKKKRWDEWDAQGKSSVDLIKITGDSEYADVVSWGYRWNDIVKEDGAYTMEGFSWANENWNNVPIRHKNGELASIAKRFPEIAWEVEYSNEYDEEGLVYPPDFED